MEPAVAKWAEKSDVPIRWPKDYRRERNGRTLGQIYDFTTSPCIDFGKYIEKVPRFELRPRDQEQLANCLRFLDKAGIPFMVRAAGHSSGGQALIEDGAVVNIRALNRIVADLPDEQAIRVEAGAYWFDVIRHLRSQKRRPIVVTDNWRSTVGGTIAVGGFGDTSHLWGLQSDNITELVVMTLDGRRHRVRQGSALFDFSLNCRGQLGVIVEATIPTIERPWMMSARMLKWRSVGEYVEASKKITERGGPEYFRGRTFWGKGYTVKALCGQFRTDGGFDEELMEGLGAEPTPVQPLDLYELSTMPPDERWDACSLGIELMMPLPGGLRIVTDVYRKIEGSGLEKFLGHGSSVMVLRGRSQQPMSILPDTDWGLMVALRPVITEEGALQFHEMLEELGDLAVASGGRVYLISVEPKRRDWMDAQFSKNIQLFRRLKSQFDRRGLLNPGLLQPLPKK